jgi:hypothetical protein
MKNRIFYNVKVMWCNEANNPHYKFRTNEIEFMVEDFDKFLNGAIECGAIGIEELREYIEKNSDIDRKPNLRTL